MIGAGGRGRNVGVPLRYAGPVRRVHAALLAASLAFPACGDDPKPPETPTPLPPLSGTAFPEPSPPPTPPVERAADWTSVRVGDAVTWEVRVEGSPLVTTLTWTATAVDAGRVRYAVTTRTTTADGRRVAETSTEESRDASAPAFPGEPVSEAVDETAVPSLGPTTRRTYRVGGEETTVWLSPKVPFGGVARVRGPGGVEQSLVRFSRGQGG
jgi:hypothetical protein